MKEADAPEEGSVRMPSIPPKPTMKRFDPSRRPKLALSLAAAVLVVGCASVNHPVLLDEDQAKIYMNSLLFPEVVATCTAAFPARAPALRQAMSAYLSARNAEIARGEKVIRGTPARSGRSLETEIGRQVAQSIEQIRTSDPAVIEPLCWDAESSLNRDARLTPSQLAQRAFDEEKRSVEFRNRSCDASLEREVLKSAWRYLAQFRGQEVRDGVPASHRDVDLLVTVPGLHQATDACTRLQARASLREIPMQGDFGTLRTVMQSLRDALHHTSVSEAAVLNARATAERFIRAHQP